MTVPFSQTIRMSDQPKEQDRAERPVRTRDAGQAAGAGPAAPEPVSRHVDSAATAALALAVTSAKRAASPPAQARHERASEPSIGRPLHQATANGVPRYAASAAALLLALAAGWFGAQMVSAAPKADPHWTATAEALRGTQEDVVRVTGDVRALKVSLEALRDGLDRSRTEAHTKQAHVIEAIGRLERNDRDQPILDRMAQLAAQLERIEAATEDPGVKLAALAERLDRIERQIATGATAKSVAPAPGPVSAAPAPVTTPAPPPAAPEAGLQTASVDPKAKDVPLDGWVLHEVYDGVALIESRNRRLIEVGPGEMVPGVGRVAGIEKRGKRWVVVTAKGVIGPAP
jgi:hypothetical protein